jgi:site-specific recombinase XerC
MVISSALLPTGRSPNAIAIVTNSAVYFQGFLISQGRTTDVTQISPHVIKESILYLRQNRCLYNHRFKRVRDRGLSAHTINCYLRSLRILFSWLVSAGIIGTYSLNHVRMPRPTRKVMPAFSDHQIQQLLKAVDTRTPEG